MKTASFSAGTPAVQSFFDTTTNTITHIVIDESTQHCAIIDSVLDYEPRGARTSFAAAQRVIEFVRERKLTVEWILETHVHADHLSAAPYLQAELGGKLGIGSQITVVQEVFGTIFNFGSEFARDASQFDKLFTDNERFSIGNLQGKVLHTPGHTPADVVYQVGDAAFVGDTIFMPDYGTARCDFPGGSAVVMHRSVQEQIFALPDATRVFLCHDYLPEGRDQYCWQTTVGAQKTDNIHLRAETSKAEFVALRTERDRGKALPRLIIPAVQVNIRAGKLPPAEADGKQYLKVPLNQL